ncbi:MAG: CBS domain-containing protein [Armatimonadota bacterium]|nr:CBS domain-containing protein [Armatimonadota bacterium]
MPTAKDLMTTDVVTIDGNATVREAIHTMKAEGVRCLIVDRRGPEDAYGIVTQRDVVYAVAAWDRDPEEVQVHEIMTKPLVVINKDLDIRHVARLLANVGLSRAPVIFDEKLQGIVSVTDIINAM